MRLSYVLPTDCDHEYVRGLIEPRRGAALDRFLAGTYLEVGYNGTDPDREAARTEITAALAQAGSRHTDVRFEDDIA